MKRIIFLGLCVLATAVLSAQTGTRSGPPEPLSISGNLGISRGMISLESGGVLYHTAGLNRFIGFIDGLKEGAAVSLTGYAFDSPRRDGIKFFRVIELNLNGKSYELAPPAVEFQGPGSGPRNQAGFPHRGNFSSRSPGNRDRGPGRHHREWNGPNRRGSHRWN